MIPETFIENWRKTVKWHTLAQVEQDLIISRALVDLYNNSQIKDALVFRGGTALNKLFIDLARWKLTTLVARGKRACASRNKYIPCGYG